MKKIYYLGTCSTCQAIIKETGIKPIAQSKDGFVMRILKQKKSRQRK